MKFSSFVFLVFNLLVLNCFSQTNESVELKIRHCLFLDNGSPAFRILADGLRPKSKITLDFIISGKTYNVIAAKDNVISSSEGDASFDIPYNYDNIPSGQISILFSTPTGIHIIESEIPKIVRPSEPSFIWEFIFSSVTYKFPTTHVFANQSVNIFADSIFFHLNPPKGWVTDINTLKDNNISALFYKNGIIYNSSSISVYIRLYVRDGITDSTTNELIGFITQNASSDGAKAKPFNDIITDSNYSLSCIALDYGDLNEIRAYQNIKNAIIEYVFVTPNLAEQKKEYNNFLSIINSYKQLQY